jgi:hypothetical protein
MPKTWILQQAAAWVQDFALFCTVVKPALFTIAEFFLFMVGLVTVVVLFLRAH